MDNSVVFKHNCTDTNTFVLPVPYKYIGIITGMLGQLSDGIWENSKSAEQWWLPVVKLHEKDGNIALEAKRDTYIFRANDHYMKNAIYNVYSNTENYHKILNKFKNTIRQIVNTYKKDFSFKLTENDIVSKGRNKFCGLALNATCCYFNSYTDEAGNKHDYTIEDIKAVYNMLNVA